MLLCCFLYKTLCDHLLLWNIIVNLQKWRNTFISAAGKRLLCWLIFRKISTMCSWKDSDSVFMLVCNTWQMYCIISSNIFVYLDAMLLCLNISFCSSLHMSFRWGVAGVGIVFQKQRTLCFPSVAPGVTEIDMPFDTWWKYVIGRDVFYSPELYITRNLGRVLWSVSLCG